MRSFVLPKPLLVAAMLLVASHAIPLPEDAIVPETVAMETFAAPPAEYMNIPCPILRALTGSGHLEWKTKEGGTSPEGVVAAIKDVLGFTGTMLGFFQGLVAGPDVPKDADGNVKLLKLAANGGHGASSGIIGAATGGAVQDNDAFNQGQFDKLIAKSSGGQFTATEWGSAVNMFAQARYDESNLAHEQQHDVAWHTNPFSWMALGGEYAQAFNILDRKVSVDAVTSIWKNGKLPSDFVSAKTSGRTIDIPDLISAYTSMNIKMDPRVIDAMVAEPTTETNAPLKAFASMLCGGDTFAGCKRAGPTPGTMIALMGGKNGHRHYCADETNMIKCNRNHLQQWEKFTVVDAGGGKVALKGGKDNKFCADEINTVKCNRGHLQQWETFTVEDAGDGLIALRGGHQGKYCADEDNNGIKCNRDHLQQWEKFKMVQGWPA